MSDVLAKLRGRQVPAWVGPLVALLLTYALFVFLSPDTFARSQNLITMARQTAVVGIAAAGMTLIIISGGIDLSVGSAVALGTVVIATLIRDGHGLLTACLGGVLIIALAGVVSGALIAKAKITPFIVTLGSMSILRGAAKGLADEQRIDADASGLDWLVILPEGWGFLIVPPAVLVLVGTCALVGLVLRYTRLGRYIIAIGSNEQAARVTGIAVDRVKMAVYGIGAGLAGIAAIVEFATLTMGDPTDAVGLELDVIAAVVIGGGSLSGGSGSVAGSLIGALLMTVIKTGCTHVGLPNWVQEILTGAIIVLAAVLDRFRRPAT